MDCMLGPIFAAIMLGRPEPTKESVEPTILSIIAIEITHLTTFTLLLLLGIQRYIWRNHVTTRLGYILLTVTEIWI